ncbi:type II toxin-antitoxin system RelE/ParE family toxin [Acidobacteria bacterium AB60]|nr:type II toxin-antitoxin system RelE/ParE family toxin [Acidobacteria bacterium AB60]
MPRIRWTQAALRDITRHFDFLSSKSRDAARRAVKTIRQGIKILAARPEAGRPIEDMLPQFREWIIEFGQGAYVVLYHFDGKEVVVLAVRHGRESGY